MESLLFLVHRLPFPPNKGDKVRSFHLLRHLAQRYRVFLGTFVDDPADWPHVEALRALCAGDARRGNSAPGRSGSRSARGPVARRGADAALFPQPAPARVGARRSPGAQRITRRSSFPRRWPSTRSSFPACGASSTWSTWIPRNGRSTRGGGPGRSRRSTRREAARLLGFERRSPTRAEAQHLRHPRGSGAVLRRWRPNARRASYASATASTADYFSPEHEFRVAVSRPASAPSCSPARWTTGRMSTP